MILTTETRVILGRGLAEACRFTTVVREQFFRCSSFRKLLLFCIPGARFRNIHDSILCRHIGTPLLLPVILVYLSDEDVTPVSQIHDHGKRNVGTYSSHPLSLKYPFLLDTSSRSCVICQTPDLSISDGLEVGGGTQLICCCTSKRACFCKFWSSIDTM